MYVSFAAQDHPGGRISSVLHNGRWIETGAQWIHGQNNEVWKLADQYDLLSAVTSSEGEGKKLIYRVIHKSLRDFRTRLRNNQD